MTIEALFGSEAVNKKRKTLRLRVITPVFTSLRVGDAAAEYLAESKILSSSVQAAQLFDFLRRESKEHFWSVHLDVRNRILYLDCVSVGSLSASVVHPREVFKSALLSSAAAILFVHNHPSGRLDPSPEDRELTRRLKEAGELLGIRVLDHLIVGQDGHFSFADRGIL